MSYPQQPPARRRRVVYLVCGLAAVVVLAGAGLWLARTSPGEADTAATRTVLYEAEGAGARGARTAFYTLQTPSGTTQGAISLPLRTNAGDTGLSVAGFRSGDFVYLSVQNKDAAGSVTCRISVGGNLVSKNTSTGGYTIATCKGVVP